MDVELRLLGPVEVWSAGRRVDAGQPRQRSVLAVLAAEVGRPVPVDTVIDRVWGDDPPRGVRQALHGHITRVRRVLRHESVGRGTSAEVVFAANCYRLEPGDATVDLHRFRWLVGEARIADCPPERQRHLLRDAVRLWRGEPLSGLTGTWVEQSRQVWRQQFFEAVVAWAYAEIERENAGAALDVLTDVVGQYPLTESVQAALIAALAASGRPADALTQYNLTRRRLSEELGADPSPELQAAYQAVLGGQRMPAGRPGRAGPSPAPVRPAAGLVDWLPRSIPDFVGRDDLLAAADGPAVGSIDGMPGSGKTSLAVRLARRCAAKYPDGMYFINLDGSSRAGALEPASAATTLLRQLGVDSDRIPAEPDGQLALWRAELSRRRCVVVLDNAADSDQVEPLLPDSGSSRVLVTSRRRLLGLQGAEPVTLPMLSTEEAVDLLTRIVGTARVNADRDAAARLVRCCGLLPLAVRLAGARLTHRPGWSVGDLLRRLTEAPSRLTELRADDRTITDVFAMSYAALGADQQRLFRLLSLSPAEHLDAPSVAALADLPLNRAEDLLVDLVDHHLVEEPSTGRYRQHDLLREYATALAHRDGDDAATALPRLLDHLLQVATHATATLENATSALELHEEQPQRPELVAARGTPDLRWIESERPNLLSAIRAAVDHDRYLEAFRLARSISRFLYHHGYLSDLQTVWNQVIPLARTIGDWSVLVTAHNYLAAARYRVGDYHAALESLSTAIEHADRAGARRRSFALRINSALICERIGSYDRITDLLADWGEIEGRHVPGCLVVRSTVPEHHGDFELTLRLLRHELANLRQYQDQFTRGMVLANLGRVRGRLGDRAAAARLLDAGLRWKRRHGNRAGAAETVNDIAVLARSEQRWEDALRLHLEALPEARAIGDPYLVTSILVELGRTLSVSGAPEPARDAFTEARDLGRRYGLRHLLAHAHAGLAELGGPHASRDHQVALALYRAIGVPPAQPPCY